MSIELEPHHVLDGFKNKHGDWLVSDDDIADVRKVADFGNIFVEVEEAACVLEQEYNEMGMHHGDADSDGSGDDDFDPTVYDVFGQLADTSEDLFLDDGDDDEEIKLPGEQFPLKVRINFDIKTLHGKFINFRKVNMGDKVQDMKKKLNQETGFDINLMKLYIKGQKVDLMNKQSLMELQAPDDDVINLTLKMRGEGGLASRDFMKQMSVRKGIDAGFMKMNMAELSFLATKLGKGLPNQNGIRNKKENLVNHVVQIINSIGNKSAEEKDQKKEKDGDDKGDNNGDKGKKEESDDGEPVPPNTDGDMQIFVQTPPGKTITLTVEPDFTTLMTKAIIKSVIGIPVKDQLLVFAGKDMDDDVSLEDAGVQSGSKLDCMVGGLGGAGKKQKLHDTVPPVHELAEASDNDEEDDFEVKESDPPCIRQVLSMTNVNMQNIVMTWCAEKIKMYDKKIATVSSGRELARTSMAFLPEVASMEVYQ
jgi:hypothetical protein